jgi:hypothetical protein
LGAIRSSCNHRPRPLHKRSRGPLVNIPVQSAPHAYGHSTKGCPLTPAQHTNTNTGLQRVRCQVFQGWRGPTASAATDTNEHMYLGSEVAHTRDPQKLGAHGLTTVHPYTHPQTQTGFHIKAQSQPGTHQEASAGAEPHFTTSTESCTLPHNTRSTHCAGVVPHGAETAHTGFYSVEAAQRSLGSPCLKKA